MTGIKPGEILIDDDLSGLALDRVMLPFIGGETKARGAIPRDYSVQPQDMLADPSGMKLIPQSEWSERIKQMEAQESRISDILLDAGIPSTDQNGQGYCWFYSCTGMLQANRAISNQPYVPLNGHSGASIIKNGADEGGWCGLAAEFIRDHGIAPMSIWPEHSRDYKKYYTDECKNEMAKYRVTEDWVDLGKQVWDQNLTAQQIATCLLNRIPCAVDFDWWGHSVLACDLVEVEPGSFGIRIRNSWTDQWGDKGFSVLRGNKAKPMGAVSFRVSPGGATE